ncbi:hypothetical protein PHSY_005178 [Pseudozyma hubeiensis SY62]|uniref:Uncharacterized protein n=1 Tax=Pseudozyma hubeiensis (strain SY62) TaxID=1305764 RepID=R9P8K4_PSEHS|nr:hypothetical protein PHSY_005178 [Pseudozyma hubeiensis SY62]GAC97592.1 hypothetical protein PHSY_005178 [Pseudozyma hubeiensis SY62]
MAPPHSRAPVAPQVLELPLQLAIVAFSVTLLGLTAWDYSRWQILKEKSRINNFVEFQDNGMLMVVLAGMIISAIGFAFGNLAAFLACLQFPKRRGERTGKGTYGYVLVGLVELVLSGAYLGIASAITAYSVNRHPSFAAGPSFSEPFTDNQKVFLRSIYEMFRTSQNGNPATSTTQSLGALGPWANITTLQQANAFLAQNRYLNYTHYRVTVAIAWVTLATTFFVMAVHFILPVVLKALGMTRPPKGQAPARSASRAPIGYGEKRNRGQGYRREEYDDY